MEKQKVHVLRNRKGFTLVELIVVITILVILGTIAFINLWGMSGVARDSQRTSDLSQISQTIMTMQAKNGTSYVTMVNTSVGTGNLLPNLSLWGQTGAVANYANTYSAWDLGYTMLGLDSGKFSDPLKGYAYKMGATSLAGWAYQIAATLEDAKNALVVWTYVPRNTLATKSAPAALTSTGTATAQILTVSNNFGNLRLNDIITWSGITGTWKVIVVSSDLTKVTFTATGSATGTGGTYVLANDEIAWLIYGTGVTWPVVQWSASVPYWIQ